MACIFKMKLKYLLTFAFMITFTGCSTPVSYTHLDVYKRQDLSNASMIDKWILKRFNEVLENVTANMEKYEYALVGNELYSFVWDDFCSWYIELSKACLLYTSRCV